MTTIEQKERDRLQPVVDVLTALSSGAGLPPVTEVVAALDEAKLLAVSRMAMGPLIAFVRERALDFKAEHGAVEISVTTGNALWQAGVDRLRLADGSHVVIENDGDGVTFMPPPGDGRDDYAMTDSLVHFHLPRPDDDDDSWDDDDDDSWAVDDEDMG